MIRQPARVRALLAGACAVALGACAEQPAAPLQKPIRIVQGSVGTLAAVPASSVPALPVVAAAGATMTMPLQETGPFPIMEDAREEAAQTAARDTDPYRLRHAALADATG